MTSKIDLVWIKKNAPLLLVLSIIVVGILIIAIDTLEDTLVEGGSFSNTPLAPLLNAIVSIIEYTTSTISSWGYSGTFLLMFLESTSLPIPSEVVLPFAGYLVSTGKMDLWLTILVSTLAGTAGCVVDYYIGMKAMDLIARREGLAGVFFRRTSMETAKRWFNKYGSITVFLSRLVPGFRTLISFPAGAIRMPLTKFIIYSTTGCLLWSAILVYAGYYLGTSWREITSMAHYIIIGVLLAIAITIGYLYVKRRATRERHANVQSSTDQRSETNSVDNRNVT